VAANYAISYVNGTLSVTPAVLTVTADNKSRGYGDANPPLTASYSGFKNGETLATSGVTGAPGLTTTATGTSAIGSYPITATIGTLASVNYTFAFVNGTLTITQATPVITWTDPAGVPMGTALSYTQLNATANTAGTFAYTPVLGTVLNTAGNQSLSVTFTPTDTTHYTTASKTVHINVIAPGTQTMTSALTITTSSVQYSDRASFTVNVTSSLAGQRPAGKVAFKVGSQTMGVSDLTPVGDPLTTTTYQAVWSGQLLEPSPSGTPPTGQLRPAMKVVSAQMLDPDPRFAMTNPNNKSMMITVEDARVTYTGSSTLTLSGGTVPLTASVTELADGYPGDLTLATVQFVNRANNAVLGTVPVAADGTATFNWTTTAGTYNIGFVVGNYYSRNNATDNVTIMVR
jgi:hypothetical protein